MNHWLGAAIAAALLAPQLVWGQTAPATGTGSKVEAIPGSTPAVTDTQTPVQEGKAATAGGGSKVEAASGSTGSTETPPTSAGASDTGSRDVTPGAGNAISEKMSPPITHASPGPEGQGPTAGPVNPPKRQ